MKRGRVLVVAAMLLAGFSLLAQQKAKPAAKPEQKAAPAKKRLEPLVYLGDSDYRNGNIPKTTFNSLMKKGITAKDSAGRVYKVIGFNFTYGERNLYEDSVGNLVVKCDFTTTSCKGDTLPELLTRYIPASQSRIGEETPGLYQRIKPGDTVYFDQVRLLRYTPNAPLPPDSLAILGKGMKFVIVK